MHVAEALARLHGIVNDDAYAATFQNFGQYRTAVAKHITNIAAAAQVAQNTEKESTMNASTHLSLVASTYPAEHPFPKALARVAELEAMLAVHRIIDVQALVRYTAKPNGGMGVDQEHGPWVLLREAMGGTRELHFDDFAVLEFTTQMMAVLKEQRSKGRNGWNKPAECPAAMLAASLVDNIRKGDVVDAAIYAMMLWHRGASAEVISDGFDNFVSKFSYGAFRRLHLNNTDAEHLETRKFKVTEICRDFPKPPASDYTREDAETFAQALIAQGWHNESVACVDVLHALLQSFLRTHGGEVAA